MIKIHARVAVLEDLPQHKLKRGHIGTVVEQWADDVYEVEFADKRGVAQSLVALNTKQLLVLYEYADMNEQSA